MVQNEAGEVFGLEKVALDHVESVTVEHENQVQVSINKVMSYLKHVFPAARKVALTNCIACEVKMNYLLCARKRKPLASKRGFKSEGRGGFSQLPKMSAEKTKK